MLQVCAFAAMIACISHLAVEVCLKQSSTARHSAMRTILQESLMSSNVNVSVGTLECKGRVCADCEHMLWPGHIEVPNDDFLIQNIDSIFVSECCKPCATVI